MRIRGVREQGNARGSTVSLKTTVSTTRGTAIQFQRLATKATATARAKAATATTTATKTGTTNININSKRNGNRNDITIVSIMSETIFAQEAVGV